MSKVWEVIPRSWNDFEYKEPSESSNHARKFSTPDDLWKAAVKYFEHCEKTPLLEQHATKMKVGDGVEEIEYYNLNKKRYMSKSSLCLFLGIDRRNYARLYESGEYGEAFKVVCDVIAAIILDEQMCGAAAGLYNPMIVARHVGLIDKQEVKQELTNDFNALLEDATDD